jgi:hypothetical protein
MWASLRYPGLYVKYLRFFSHSVVFLGRGSLPLFLEVA